MAKLSIVAGATSQSVNCFIQDSSSTVGAGLSGLVYNTSNLAAYYSFAGANATATAITLATLAGVTSAWATGGFIELDATHMKGTYRLDLPNAVLAAAKGRSVTVYLYGAANMAPCVFDIELTGWDNQDAVHGGMSALPNAAATAAGGLPVSLAGSLDLDEMNVDIEAIQTSTAGLTFTVSNKVDATVTGYTAGQDVASRRGTAQTGAAGTITLDSGASATDNLYQYGLVVLLSGTGAGQARFIASYVGSTKVATITPNWTTAPDSTSLFAIIPWGQADVAYWNESAVPAGSAGVPEVDLRQILGAPLSGSATNIRNSFDTFFNVASSTLTCADINQTGDSYARLGAPAGASIAADLAEIEAETDGIAALPTGAQVATAVWQDTTAGDFTVAASIGKSVLNGVALGTGLTINAYTGDTPQTGDVYGALTGANTEVTSVPTSTDTLINMIKWLFALGRNKLTQTSTTTLLRNNADGATIGTSTVSDDGTTFTRGKFS